MSNFFDAVVVGARVAGSATALHLARAGHSVLVVDRAGPPTDTTSTHALMRTGILQLRRAGLLDAVIEAGTPAIRQVNLVFGDERITFPVSSEFGVDAYYAPRRTILDSILLEAAVEAGAEFRRRTTVTDVLRDSTGRVNGVSLRSGNGQELAVQARYVIGADGTNSRIARSVGAQEVRRAPAHNAVVYGYFAGVDASGYDFRFVGQRNIGLIPTNDGLTLAFVGGPLDVAPTDSEGYLMDTMRQLAPDIATTLESGDRVERLRRSNGITSVLRDPAGPGWLLVGDAGFTEDPISAHGMADALRDADLGAEAIDQSLRHPSIERDAQDRYRTTRDRLVHHLLDHTIPLAKFEWDGPEASRLLRGIGAITDAECRLLAHRNSIGMVYSRLVG